MRTFDVEGTVVHCEQLEGRRVWSCSCKYYKQRVRRTAVDGSVAYCPHVAVAIMRSIQDGTIDPTDEAAGEFEVFVQRSDGLLW